jgi:hypothetical protein
MPVNGILHLDPVPKFNPPQGVPRFLLDVIRKAAGTIGRDRNMTLEDYYHEVFSYFCIAENTYLVRIAAIDRYGRPNDVQASTLPVLFDTLLHMGRHKYLVIRSAEERYDHFYSAFRLGNACQEFKRDYLFVPDDAPRITTLVFLRKR